MTNQVQQTLLPLRIVHVLATLNRGGAETLVMNLYRSIDRTSVQFDFVVHYKRVGAFAEEVKKLGGKIYICPTFSIRNFISYIKWWLKFFQEHPEYQILHSHIRSSALFYLMIARWKGVKTIIHSHSTNNGNGIQALIKSVLQYPLRVYADYYFACSKMAGEWLFGKRIVDSKRFLVVKNGINVEKFRFNIQKRKQTRNDLQFGDEHVFIHVGGLRAVKNHEFLLDVFNEIHRKDMKSKLILVGSGELENEIYAKIQHLKLEDFVMMLGSRSDVDKLLQAADCFLLPSLWEGVPTSVIEAQAAGLHCCISDQVSDDVVISSLVKRLPIKQGIKPWVEEIQNIVYEHIDVITDIQSSGYDIKIISNQILEFYENIQGQNIF